MFVGVKFQSGNPSFLSSLDKWLDSALEGNNDGIQMHAGNMQTYWGQEYWWPGQARIGTRWINTLGDRIVGNIADHLLGAICLPDIDEVQKQLVLGDIGFIFWICAIQFLFAIISAVIACITPKREDGRDINSMHLEYGCVFFDFLIGIMGILAVKFDCKELLIATVICALISLIFAALYLLITVIGIFIAAFKDCRESIRLLCVGIFMVVSILSSSLFNVLLVIKALPYAFGEDALDQISDKFDELQNKMNL